MWHKKMPRMTLCAYSIRYANYRHTHLISWSKYTTNITNIAEIKWKKNKLLFDYQCVRLELVRNRHTSGLTRIWVKIGRNTNCSTRQNRVILQYDKPATMICTSQPSLLRKLCKFMAMISALTTQWSSSGINRWWCFYIIVPFDQLADPWNKHRELVLQW